MSLVVSSLSSTVTVQLYDRLQDGLQVLVCVTVRPSAIAPHPTFPACLGKRLELELAPHRMSYEVCLAWHWHVQLQGRVHQQLQVLKPGSEANSQSRNVISVA